MENELVETLLEEHKRLLGRFKEHAINYFSKGKLNLSLRSIRAFATVAANINLVYSDDELEVLLGEIAVQITSKGALNQCANYSNKIVFYDGFDCTNVPLTLQYIRALKSTGFDILYLFEDSKIKSDPEILRELSSSFKITVQKLSSTLSPSQKILEAYNMILEFNPSKAFLHLGEVHVEAIAIFSLFPKIIKYRINLGDHHFWLGAKQLDFCLEFREYGATISVEKRGISASKLLYQPYYPYIDERSFEGFPFQRRGDEVIMFSGGRLYKIFGRNYEYFSIVKRILDDNPKVIFILAGKNGGDTNYIFKFIKLNKFEKRFYYLGHRRDINEVFKRCDIYLNTYPQSGGLMCMYAAVNKKPILTYTSEDLPENCTENLLYNYSSKNNITFNRKEHFFSHVTELVNNQVYRRMIGDEMPKYVITQPKFNELLNLNLHKQEVFNYENIKIDYEALVNLNLEMEYTFYNMTSYALLKNFSWRVFILFPNYSMKVVHFVLTWFLKK